MKDFFSHGYIVVIMLFSIIQAYPQQNPVDNKILQNKIDLLRKSQFSAPLFLHLDKNVYTENEPIWFTAYLINNAAFDISRHKILTLFLFREDDRVVALSGKFIMVDGLCTGDLVLPDSITSGKYQLFAHTDVLDKDGRPLASFTAPLTLKSTTVQTFNSSVVLMDSTVKDASIKAKVIVNFAGNQSKKKKYPFVSYMINRDTLQSLELKTNEAVIDISEKYLRSNHPILHTSVSHNNQTQHLNTRLPSIASKQIKLNFFPEGGELADGIPSTVAFEARSEDGSPVALSGILLKGNAPIDTITTNNYGVGRFRFTPDGTSRYTLKVKAAGYLSHDTVYTLPKVTNNHLVMHLPNAVANDSLQVQLYSKKQQAFQILVHNNKGFYTLFKAKVGFPADTLKIPLYAISKGVATLTVLDELGRPLAERLFFAGYSDRITTNISVNKPKYTKRESVSGKINLTDQSGAPVKGLFSIAAVQSNRLENTFQFIDDYVYLKKGLDLSLQSLLSRGTGIDNKVFLEDMLLIKGWRRYTWQSLAQANPQDTIREFEYPPKMGRVKKSGKTLKDSVNIAILGSSSLHVITTETDGSFKITDDQLHILKSDKKLLLMVSDKKSTDFSIELDDPSINIHKKLADEMKIYSYTTGIQNITKSDDGLLKGLENAKQLGEVVISVRNRSNYLYGYRGKPGANACGDYVDEQGFLNYEFSVNRYQPIVGKLYRKRTDLSADRSVFKVDPALYNGCQTKEYSGGLQIDGVYGEREFYGVESSETEPQYLSTLFWKPLVLTNDLGEAEFQFDTGDINDEFRIVIQGISDDDVFSGNATFWVE